MRTTSPKDILVDGLLRIVSQQWAALGAGLRADPPPRAVVDPEALLWCTLEIGRYDSRVFDEVIDWLGINHARIVIPRLRCIGPETGDIRWAILSAIAQRLRAEKGTAKWANIAKLQADDSGRRPIPLFFDPQGSNRPISSHLDGDFAAKGLGRTEFETRGLSRQPRLTLPACLLLRAQSVFGYDARAYVWTALLTREGDFGSAVRRTTGYGPIAGPILKDFVSAGICRAESRPGRSWYCLCDRETWRHLLDLRQYIPPWPNWIGLFRGLIHLCRTLHACREKSASQYIVASELRGAFTEVRDDISGCGLIITSPNPELYLADEFIDRLATYLREVLDGSLFLP